MTQTSKGPENFELKMANGNTRSFQNGYDMWRWAVQNDPKMEFPPDDKPCPSISDFFERLRKKSAA